MQPQSLNGWNYVGGNPVNWVDPSGRCPAPGVPECDDPWLPFRDWWENGPIGTYTGPLGYYRAFVHFWRWVYRKDNSTWNCDVNGDGQYNDDDGINNPSDTSYDLVRDFVCEYGPQTRYFNEQDQSTKNLRNSAGITIARNKFYWFGKDTGVKEDERKFGVYEALIEANLDLPFDRGVSHILGGYSYKIERLGPLLRFRVENNMTRESGTRVPLSYEGITHEDILDNPSLIGAPVVSVLRPQPREQTIDPVGGGNMRMIYYWHEFYDECRHPIILYPNAPIAH